MKKMLVMIPVIFVSMMAVQAQAQTTELVCDIRDSGGTLSCFWNGKEKKMMTADEIPAFVDMADAGAYITLKSRKGMERTYFIDGNAPQYKRLRELKKSASISELSRAKSELFNDIEKKVIKISDELDGQAATAELVKYDPSVANDKFKREARFNQSELDAFRRNKEKACTTTPEFERVSKSNMALQNALSNIVLAFQSPQSCLNDLKLVKDKDGAVDLKQLEGIEERFLAQCKKK